MINLRIDVTPHGMHGANINFDACGVGPVAATDGGPWHRVVQSAINLLKAIWRCGVSLPVWAIRDGRDAAASVHRWLRVNSKEARMTA